MATSRPSPTDTPATVARFTGRAPRSTYHRSGPLRAPNLRAWTLGRAWRLVERGDPQDPGDLLAGQRLALEEGTGERVELLEVGLDHVTGARGALDHDPLDLGVDQDRGLLAEVLGSGHLAAEEDVLLALAEGERAHLVGHAPLADHLAGHLGGLLEGVARPGRLLLEDDLLRC